jgi:hypothetical protein
LICLSEVLTDAAGEHNYVSNPCILQHRCRNHEWLPIDGPIICEAANGSAWHCRST